MATLDEEDAPFDAPPSCANNPNASAMGAAEWAASAGSSGEAYAPFVTIIEAQALRLVLRSASWPRSTPVPPSYRAPPARREGQLLLAGAPEAAPRPSACLRLPSAPGSLGKLPAALAVLAGQSLISGLFSDPQSDRVIELARACVDTSCTYGLRALVRRRMEACPGRGTTVRVPATRPRAAPLPRTAAPQAVALTAYRGTPGARDEQRRRVRPGLRRRAFLAARRRQHGLPLHRLRGQRRPGGAGGGQGAGRWGGRLACLAIAGTS
eukprot:scaffold23266_cov60-Phaeocystis_antarctica.AAC.1